MKKNKTINYLIHFVELMHWLLFCCYQERGGCFFK